jgi:hypothetical protein
MIMVRISHLVDVDGADVCSLAGTRKDNFDGKRMRKPVVRKTIGAFAACCCSSSLAARLSSCVVRRLQLKRHQNASGACVRLQTTVAAETAYVRRCAVALHRTASGNAITGTGLRCTRPWTTPLRWVGLGVVFLFVVLLS